MKSIAILDVWGMSQGVPKRVVVFTCRLRDVHIEKGLPAAERIIVTGREPSQLVWQSDRITAMVRTVL